MIVTAETKYSDFAQYENVLTDESTKALKEAAEKAIKPCHMLTVDEFFGLCSGDLQLLGDMSDPSVLQVYWLKRFRDFCEEFTKSCEKLSPKDQESEGLNDGCVKLNAQEHMLVFIRDYFSLHDFNAAGRITIGEYILARKDTFNSWRVRKNSEAKQLAKIKNKKR